MSNPKKAKKLKFICTEVTSSYRSQKLSCLKFEELPNELIIGTLSYLNMKDLINCGQVSKRFRAIVGDEQGRRKEDLLKIIQDLQCFKCKKVPRPCGNQSKRYLCEKSQSLCITWVMSLCKITLYRWHPRIQSRSSEVVLVQTEPSGSKLKAMWLQPLVSKK